MILPAITEAELDVFIERVHPSYDIDSEGGIKALTLAKDLVDSGAMSKECINWTQGDVMNQFISGNVAMMINGPWQIPTMQQEAPDLNWNVALIPKDAEYASCLGGENYAVIKDGNVVGGVVGVRSKREILKML